MNDLHLTFGEIFNNNLEALTSQLVQVQKEFRHTREDSEEWVQTLRFLDVSRVPALGELDDQRSAKRRCTGSRSSINQTSYRGVNTACNIPIVEENLGEVEYVALLTVPQTMLNNINASSFNMTRLLPPPRTDPSSRTFANNVWSV
jgi:hypothetical protein